MDTGARAASMSDLHLTHRSPARDAGPDHHRSLGDLRGTSPHRDEFLLDHGSPASGGHCDPALLDEDSDNPDCKEHTDGDTVTPMTVDIGSTGY